MITLVRGRAAEKALASDLNANFLDLDNDCIVTTLTGLAANGTFTVPAGYRISSIDVINTTANAVTGGINIGTAALGAQIAAEFAVGASARLTVAPLVHHFAAEQIVYISAHTAWNSASLTVVVMLDQMSD